MCPPHAAATERRPCSSRSLSPVCRAHSSKPTAACFLLWVYAGTDIRTDTVSLNSLVSAYYAGSADNSHNCCGQKLTLTCVAAVVADRCSDSSRAIGPVCACMCFCVCVRAIIFDINDFWPRYPTCWYIRLTSTPRSNVKVVGQSSLSQWGIVDVINTSSIRDF